MSVIFSSVTLLESLNIWDFTFLLFSCSVTYNTQQSSQDLFLGFPINHFYKFLKYLSHNIESTTKNILHSMSKSSFIFLIHPHSLLLRSKGWFVDWKDVYKMIGWGANKIKTKNDSPVLSWPSPVLTFIYPFHFPFQFLYFFLHTHSKKIWEYFSQLKKLPSYSIWQCWKDMNKAGHPRNNVMNWRWLKNNKFFKD